MKVYILSPHIDDAAFGLTLTISKLINELVPVTIINCFTITKWTGVFVSGETEVVTKLRKQEDAEFNQLFNSSINIINLNLLDAPLRNGYIIQNKPFEPNEWELVETIKNYLAQNCDGLLFCPLAIGNHIDHAICREAVLQLYNTVPVLFYEDLPYTFRISASQISAHIAELEKRLNVRLVANTNDLSPDLVNKEKAVRTYKSQINEDIISEILSHMNNLSGERTWAEAANTDLFRSLFQN